MAIGNIRMGATYIARIPGHPASIEVALRDLNRAIAHIQKYAERKKINLRESMKT